MPSKEDYFEEALEYSALATGGVILFDIKITPPVANAKTKQTYSDMTVMTSSNLRYSQGGNFLPIEADEGQDAPDDEDVTMECEDGDSVEYEDEDDRDDNQPFVSATR